MIDKWTEASIARAVQRQLFSRSVVVVPCCCWTGYEADLLVVTKDLRLIDVEIKISRSDLKADLKKDKWWHMRTWSRSRFQLKEGPPPARRDWPPKVWKHYYALPAAIWHDRLLAVIPKTSGVLLLSPMGKAISVRRPAKPNKDAQPLAPHEAIDLARLANLRMWDALTRTPEPPTNQEQ